MYLSRYLTGSYFSGSYFLEIFRISKLTTSSFFHRSSKAQSDCTNHRTPQISLNLLWLLNVFLLTYHQLCHRLDCRHSGSHISLTPSVSLLLKILKTYYVQSLWIQIHCVQDLRNLRNFYHHNQAHRLLRLLTPLFAHPRNVDSVVTLATGIVLSGANLPAQHVRSSIMKTMMYLIQETCCHNGQYDAHKDMACKLHISII